MYLNILWYIHIPISNKKFAKSFSINFNTHQLIWTSLKIKKNKFK